MCAFFGRERRDHFGRRRLVAPRAIQYYPPVSDVIELRAEPRGPLDVTLLSSLFLLACVNRLDCYCQSRIPESLGTSPTPEVY